MQNDEFGCEEEPFDESVLDEREATELDELADRYKRMMEPGLLAKAGQKVAAIVPASIKEVVSEAGDTISEQQFYQEAMKMVGRGFSALEEQAARVTVSEKSVLRKADAFSGGRKFNSLDELCFLRSYEVARIAAGEKLPNLLAAAIEGGATGVLGFAGIVPNIVTSTFCYYRAVQSVAMSYGYDVKNDPDELVIASEVFTTAMAPGANGAGEMSGIIGKIMMISEAEAVKQTVKKGWSAMASRGGVCLLVAQMRGLAHKSAKKAIEKAGKEGLENSVFRSILEQLGKRLSQKAVQRAIPLVSAAIGALFDTGEMSKVLSFADIFYRKRFILEKAERQKACLERATGVCDDGGEVADGSGAVERDCCGQDEGSDAKIGEKVLDREASD